MAKLELRPYQDDIINAVGAAWSEGDNRACVWLPTGGGKCLGKGTPVLMFDGTVKPVEDIKTGDLLMGPDSRPRRVLSTCQGWEMLYRVGPVKGEPYIVNESHILSLRMTGTDQIVNISVTDYLARSATFKHIAKGWRTGVEFAEQAVDPDMPPYILGVWLGDGSHRKPDITTADAFVAGEWINYARAVGCDVRMDIARNCVTLSASKGCNGGRVKNPVTAALSRAGVLFDKHIPHNYKANSRDVRLEILAGILDTDGYLHHGHYELTVKQKRLADDVAFVARSLGLAAYVSPCVKRIKSSGFSGEYYRVSISGDVDMIPCRVARRLAEPRQQKKNVLNVGITVEPIGVGDYYGFEIDGDKLFLLGDFTVTHNTELAAGLALAERDAGGHTLFVVERKVLCAQGSHRFRKYGMLPGIIRGEDTFIRGYEAVTVASIQTLKSRHDNAEIEEVLKRTTLIIVDEAHILFKHHDKLFERLPHARAVGLTATPLRDGLGLRYQRLIRGPSYDWMIENGFLVRPRYFMPNSREVEAGLKGVEVSSAGDYKDGQLSALMRQKTILGDVVGNWKAKAEDRQTITFCVDIAHSQALVDEFQTAGIPAEHIDCHTEDDDRTRIFQRFRNGETKVLCSVGVLALGFDEPQTGCVILARPTLSLALHIQQVGRGLRIHPGKTDALIFDHAGNIHRHGRIEDFNPPELSELNKHSDKKRRTDFAEDCKPCPNCSAVLEPKQRICHECGHEIGRKNQVDFIPAELTEAGREVAPGVSRDDLKRVYRMNLWMSRAKGWRPGAAYMRTLERFKISPEVAKQQRLIPWGWKDLDPLPPDDAYQRWEQSRRIAYAKSRR